MSDEKQITPPYVSYRTLTTFFNQAREAQVVPSNIDRSFLQKFSGAAQSEIQQALKFLAFTDDKNNVLATLEPYVMSSDEQRKALLSQIIKDRYSFVLDAPNLVIEKATTTQVADLFRAKKLTGSTLSRSVSFFLAALKEVDIKTASYLAAPPISRDGEPKKVKKQTVTKLTDDGFVDENDNALNPKALNFQIPIPNKPSVKISIPADFDADDWELLTVMFQAYVKRWKSLPQAS